MESSSSAVSGPSDASGESSPLTLSAKWGGKTVEVTVPPGATVGDLKEVLWKETQVRAKRQKLIGLVKGKMPDDSATLCSLNINNNSKFMFVGTPEENIATAPSAEEMPDVLNDLDDFDYSTLEVWKHPVHQYRLQQTTKKTEINLIHPFREGKKLLVLDLDYTLFDCKAQLPMPLLKRPGLEEFMTEAFAHYDICVWSQTKWRWVEAKLTDLGLLTNPNFHISFVMDQSSMFSVNKNPESTSTREQHQVKSLDIIWNKFPDKFSAKNTVHVDDLARNFAMNPKSGIKISAWKVEKDPNRQDIDLFILKKYLNDIASVDDFTTLDHADWKKRYKNK